MKSQPLKIVNTKLIPTARRNLASVSPSTFNTLTTINQWDTTSFVTQQSLLQKYNLCIIVKTTYITNLNLVEATGSITDASTPSSMKNTINILIPYIDYLAI